jgi:prepilin-type N-terminal cleavage/methylation domain-containing protein
MKANNQSRAFTLVELLVVVAIIAASLPVLSQTNFTKITTGPIATSGGKSLSAAWVDFDGDGKLDLFVTANQPTGNLLYRNDGTNGFSQVTISAVVNVGAGSFGSSWADFDNDGRIDLFIGRRDAPGLLFRQQADRSFSQDTLPLNLSFGAAWADYDQDGLLDLLVADLVD